MSSECTAAPRLGQAVRADAGWPSSWALPRPSLAYCSCCSAHSPPSRKELPSAAARLFFWGDQDFFWFHKTSRLLLLCDVYTHIHTYKKHIYFFSFHHTPFPPVLCHTIFSCRFCYVRVFLYPHLCKYTIPHWLLCRYTLFLYFYLDFYACC